jgi:hypothetical protein
MVESAHKRKGTLTFEPPNLDEVTYDIESCQITEAPADGPRMTQRIQEFVIEFECKPYGRLASFTVLTDRDFAGPIDGAEINAEDVPGHVDALGELTLTDTSSESADFVEFGIGQQGYDPDAELLIAAADFNLLEGTLAGGIITTVLTDEPVGCCATGELSHGGKQKISVRFNTTDAVWVRLAWRLDESPRSYGRWIEIPPGVIGDQELTLAIIDIGPASQWEARIEAFDSSGSGEVDIKAAYIIPAEVCGRVRWSSETYTDHALWADQRIRIDHRGARREDETGSTFGWIPLDGDTLRIPAATGAALTSLLVIRRRLNDIDSATESDGRFSDVTATLEITPRVALY